MGRAGRPQGEPRGRSEQANALARFALELTRGATVRELAERYHISKTVWGEYRSGQKAIPLDLLERLVDDRTKDGRTRQSYKETAARLHRAAVEADPGTGPVPSAGAKTPEAARAHDPAPVPVPEPVPEPEPEPVEGRAPVKVHVPVEIPPRQTAVLPRSPRLWAVVAVVVTVLLAVALLTADQDSSPDTDVSGAPGAPPGATSASRAPQRAAPPAVGSVFTIGPGGRGIYRWDGQGAAWTRIGDTAERLWAGPAGLFATGTRDQRLHVYGGRPGVWSPIAEPGRDFAVSGSHVYRLAKDGSAVFVWDGEGTSWTRIGGPAARLYGGEPGLFATDPEDGRIFKYRGRPGDWEYAGTAGAAFALTDRHLYGLTLERDAVNRWLGSRRKETEYRWTRAAGPAGALYGGAAGLFSTDPRGERLRRYDEDSGEWRDIGPAGAEVSVGDREVYRLAANRAAVFRWDRNSRTWHRIGGPAQTLTAVLTH